VPSRTPMRPFRCHAHAHGTNVFQQFPRHASRIEVGDSRGRPKSVAMSAAEGVVRTDSLGSAPPTRETRIPTSAASGAVSPELALIDANLARELRAELPEPAPPSRVVESPAAPAVVVEPQRQVAEPQPPAPARGRRYRKVRVLGLVALGALLTVFVRSEQRPPVLDRISTVADPNAQARTPEQSAPSGSAARNSTPVGQTFVWAADPDAAAYEFQLFRGAARIYRARVTAPRLVLPGQWRQGARSFRLTAGSYRWYVWPISARTGDQARVATVQATLVVAGPSR